MKRQFESTEDSSCDSSSSYENSTNIPTKTSSSSTTSIRNTNNNRSRRYVDNIVQPPPQPTTSLPSVHNNSQRNNNTQLPTDSFSFVNSTTKVPTNRRHLKLRKQLKACTDFSASYFVLDVNAPAANTIGFMGSTRGNDIPVLLTDPVSNNNQPTVSSLPSNPPSRKKTKRESIDFVSNRKGGKKSWVASVNTTVSSSSNNVNSSTTPTTTNSTQSNTTTTQQSFLQQLVSNPTMNSQIISNHPNNVLIPNTLPINQQLPQPNQFDISNNHLLRSMNNSFQYQQNNQSMIHPLSNMYTNVQNTVPQDGSFQLETLLSCFANAMNNPIMSSSSIGQLQNYSNNSLDSSPITTPSTPSTNNNGIASPIIGSLINANLPQVNSYTNSAGNSFGVQQSFSQSNTNVPTANPEVVNRNQMLFDFLTHDEARILLNTLKITFLQNKLQNC